MRILVDLRTLTVEGAPMETPANMRGLKEHSFHDLTGLEKVPPPEEPRPAGLHPGFVWNPQFDLWLDKPEHVGKGMWPAKVIRPALGPNQKYAAEADAVVDPATKTVTVTYAVEDMTAEEIAARDTPKG